MTSTTRRLIRQQHTGAIPIVPPPIPGVTTLAPAVSRRVDPRLLWPALFVFVLAVALAFVVGMLNRAPVPSAPVVAVAPTEDAPAVALASPPPTYAAVVIPDATPCPLLDLADADTMHVDCLDGRYRYDVHSTREAVAVSERHGTQNCVVAPGWSTEIQLAWQARHP